MLYRLFFKKRATKLTAAEKKQREDARTLVEARLTHFNEIYAFSYKRVAIRNQKTRWGSCSSHKNLNFHYKILFLSPELADYLIVHELCHLQEMNHGAAFWSLVSKTIPDYSARRHALRHLSPRTVPIRQTRPSEVS
jgi:predicted metal-dependent hydrolase